LYRFAQATVLGCALSILLPAQAAQSPAPADSLKSIEPADIVDLRAVSDPEISPDGKLIVYTVSRGVPGADHDDTSIWLVPADASQPERPLVFGVSSADHARWAPDGRRIAFLSDRANPLSKPDAAEAGDRLHQLWLLSLEGGEAQPITWTDGDVADFRWSPDGQRIAFLLADRPPAQERERIARKQDAIEVDAHPRPQHVWVYDFRKKSAEAISPPDLHVSMLEWSPDGTRLALRTAKTPDINAHWYRSNIAVLEVDSRRLSAPLPERAAAVSPVWSPDGQRIAFSEIFSDGIGVQPRIYDLRSGQSKACGGDYPGLLLDMHWAREGRSLLVHTFEKTRTGFARLDPAKCAVTHVTDAFFNAPYDFSLSDDGRTVVYVGNSFTQPTEVWVMRGKSQRAVTNTNPQTASWNLGTGREISWTSTKDGKTIYGILVTPPGYVAGVPVKTVVQIHGGPEWAWWSGWYGSSWHEWAQMLASHGYAVLMPNPRGSDGQGLQFAQAVKGDWGGGDFQDVLDGVDALIKQRVIDASRLGIGGWSYGGFMSAWAVTHTDRFKAAVVGAAPVDLSSMTLTTDTPAFLPGYFGDVIANHAAYEAHSSVRMIDRVHTPVLILHGEQDQRVPISQGQQFYIGLRELGRPVQMVRYPREPHWIHEYEHEKDILARVLNWFDSHL
jgi:dipeptidyl aminopeptidase/acylaminoacyl peptidase